MTHVLSRARVVLLAPGIDLIRGYAYSGPYEDLRVKK